MNARSWMDHKVSVRFVKDPVYGTITKYVNGYPISFTRYDPPLLNG